MDPRPSCIICYEEQYETETTRLIALDPCGHGVCHECLQTWAEHCERQGKLQIPCPYCKQGLGNEWVDHILGRPYVPAAAYHDSDQHDEQVQEWLSLNRAQQCGHCGVWVLHNGGCAAMMCLCGYRWCWECQTPFDHARSCTCRHLSFYDNVLECETALVPRLATPQELNDGLRAFMADRLQRRRAVGDDDGDDDDSLEFPARRHSEDGGGILWDYLMELENPNGDNVNANDTGVHVGNQALLTTTDNQGIVQEASTTPSRTREHGRHKWKRPRILTLRFWTGRLRRGRATTRG